MVTSVAFDGWLEEVRRKDAVAKAAQDNKGKDDDNDDDDDKPPLPTTPPPLASAYIHPDKITSLCFHVTKNNHLCKYSMH